MYSMVHVLATANFRTSFFMMTVPTTVTQTITLVLLITVSQHSGNDGSGAVPVKLWNVHRCVCLTVSGRQEREEERSSRLSSS